MLMKKLVSALVREMSPAKAKIDRRGACHRSLFEDKVKFGRFLRSSGVPATHDRAVINHRGIAIDPNTGASITLRNFPDGSYFVKRSTGSGGEGAWTFNRCGGTFTLKGERVSFETLMKNLVQTAQTDPHKNAVIQDYVCQHDAMATLCSSSINTLRLLTFCDIGGKEPYLAHCCLRVGSGAGVVDNLSSGGFAVLVKNGKTYGPGWRMNGTSSERHPVTSVSFEGRKIPFWEECIHLCLRAHSLFEDLGSAGWDVAITPHGPVLIEGNLGWGAMMHTLVDSSFRPKMARTAIRNILILLMRPARLVASRRANPVE